MRKKITKLLDKAYAKYSNVHVSAILITNDGKEYSGVNVENAAYPSGICAERTAIFTAVTNGVKPGEIKEIHIASNLGARFLFPCGGCRQVMAEFLLPESKVVIYNNESTKEYTLGELLPNEVTSKDILWK